MGGHAGPGAGRRARRRGRRIRSRVPVVLSRLRDSLGRLRPHLLQRPSRRDVDPDRADAALPCRHVDARS